MVEDVQAQVEQEAPVEGEVKEEAQNVADEADSVEKKSDEPVEEAPAAPATPVDRSDFNCSACGGEGLKDQQTLCPVCNGTGKVA